MNVIVLGAGPTGLGAAHQLATLGHNDWHLYEKAGHIGGLSASFQDEHGFTWDVGGHVLFSHYDYFDTVVENSLAGEYLEHQRECWIRILDTWVPYPFQNNIRYLPAEVRDECLAGLKAVRPEVTSTAHFREWMEAQFGAGIVKYFMEPYNRKVWGVPLESMGTGWVSERVSIVDIQKIERNIAEGRDDLSWGPNNRFRFPRQGGTGAIFRGIAKPLASQITLNHEVIAVDLEKRELLFNTGKKVTYDVLVSTIPLDHLITICRNVPERERCAAAGLVHNSGLIVGVGCAGTRNDSKCWMYFPSDTVPFYRVTNFHNYSPGNVPDGKRDHYFSLMCETTYSPHKQENRETIVAETIQGLLHSAMMTEQERESIVSEYLIDIDYSYPVPTANRDRELAIIQPYLEAQGVFSRGRFGAWKYEVGNMDHSFMQGVEIIERILHGTSELTVGGTW